MYLRHTTRVKDGKAHTYWRLVRSVRVGRKVVQQTVAQLGELDAEGRAQARALARTITGGREQADLFAPIPAEAPPIPVRLDRVRLERSRLFGDVWLGWTLWRALHLDTLLERLLPIGREEVPWATMALVLVLARLCEPSSELHIAEDWYRRTALDDVLALPAPLVNDDRCYRALDRLLPHKTALEQHLVQRLGELFALDYELLLYDVTSTYFEGAAARNPLAQRGHSRDHRPDCKQVCLALVVTREGMPLGYELFAGNKTDVTTVQEIVGTMETRYGQAQRIWVMDRGMTSGQPHLAAADRPALRGRHPEERAAQVGGPDRGRPGLADRARGRGGQALCRARRGRDLCPDPLGRAPGKGAGDAPALRPADRGGPHHADPPARPRPPALGARAD